METQTEKTQPLRAKIVEACSPPSAVIDQTVTALPAAADFRPAKNRQETAMTARPILFAALPLLLAACSAGPRNYYPGDLQRAQAWRECCPLPAHRHNPPYPPEWKKSLPRKH